MPPRSNRNTGSFLLKKKVSKNPGLLQRMSPAYNDSHLNIRSALRCIWGLLVVVAILLIAVGFPAFALGAAAIKGVGAEPIPDGDNIFPVITGPLGDLNYTAVSLNERSATTNQFCYGAPTTYLDPLAVMMRYDKTRKVMLSGRDGETNVASIFYIISSEVFSDKDFEQRPDYLKKYGALMYYDRELCRGSGGVFNPLGTELSMMDNYLGMERHHAYLLASNTYTSLRSTKDIRIWSSNWEDRKITVAEFKTKYQKNTSKFNIVVPPVAYIDVGSDGMLKHGGLEYHILRIAGAKIKDYCAMHSEGMGRVIDVDILSTLLNETHSATVVFGRCGGKQQLVACGFVKSRRNDAQGFMGVYDDGYYVSTVLLRAPTISSICQNKDFSLSVRRHNRTLHEICMEKMDFANFNKNNFNFRLGKNYDICDIPAVQSDDQISCDVKCHSKCKNAANKTKDGGKPSASGKLFQSAKSGMNAFYIGMGMVVVASCVIVATISLWQKYTTARQIHWPVRREGVARWSAVASDVVLQDSLHDSSSSCPSDLLGLGGLPSYAEAMRWSANAPDAVTLINPPSYLSSLNLSQDTVIAPPCVELIAGNAISSNQSNDGIGSQTQVAGDSHDTAVLSCTDASEARERLLKEVVVVTRRWSQ